MSPVTPAVNPLAVAVELVADQQAFIKHAADEQARLRSALAKAEAELTQNRQEVARLTKLASAAPATPFARAEVTAVLGTMLSRGLIKDASAMEALTQDILARPGTLLKLASKLVTAVPPLASEMGRATPNNLSEPPEEAPMTKSAGDAPRVNWSLIVTEGA